MSFHPSLGSVTAHERGTDGRLAPLLLDPEHDALGRAELPRGEVRPVRRARRPELDRASASATSPRRRGVADARADRRRDLRARVDRFRRFADKAAGDPAVALDDYYEQGYELMSSNEAQAAFDVGREDPTVRDRYGRNPFGQRACSPAAWSRPASPS